MESLALPPISPQLYGLQECNIPVPLVFVRSQVNILSHSLMFSHAWDPLRDTYLAP